jgi:hypothetical protein
MNRVRRKREAGRAISPEILGQAVDKLAAALQKNSAAPASPAGRALNDDCEYLMEAVYFSRDKYHFERIRLFNLRRFSYPVDLNATEGNSFILAPTAMGNIGGTMRSYAQRHYGFDLDVLWTRLQNASQSSTSFYGVLQDAKAQLDFLVALTCLMLATTCAWLLLELLIYRSAHDFVVIGIIGPLVVFLLYVLCCRAYNVFADLMRSCVDLFRFKVLSDLHIPLPLGLEEERQVWHGVANLMGYENPGEAGAPLSLTYKH